MSDQNFRPDHGAVDAQSGSVGAESTLGTSHNSLDSHSDLAGAEQVSRPDQRRSDAQMVSAGAGSTSHVSHITPDIQDQSADVGAISRPDHMEAEAQRYSIGAGPTSAASGHDGFEAPQEKVAGGGATSHVSRGAPAPSTSQQDTGDQELSAGAGSTSRPDQIVVDSQISNIGAGPILYDPSIGFLAAQLDAIEDLRKATANRHRMATRDVEDSDGHMRGLGLSPDNPAVARSAVMLDALEKIEHEVVLELQRHMRQHPLWLWYGARFPGIGQKSLARLLAAIGDPYWNTMLDRPRTLYQLFAYCGLHTLPSPGQSMTDDLPTLTGRGGKPGGDPNHPNSDNHASAARVAARRTRGQRANWSTQAKTRAFLLAESCLKQGTYRDVYDDHKKRAADAVHVADCAPCKAKAGTPLKAGHQNARALRAMSKAILKDLFNAARNIHQAGESG